MLGKKSIALALVLVASGTQVAAQEAEVIMRRPLPVVNGQGNGGSTVDPSNPSGGGNPVPAEPGLTSDPGNLRDPSGQTGEEAERIQFCIGLLNEDYDAYLAAGCDTDPNQPGQITYTWDVGPWEGTAACGTNGELRRDVFCYMDTTVQDCSAGYGNCVDTPRRFPASVQSCIDFANVPAPPSVFSGATAGCDYKIIQTSESNWEYGCTQDDQKTVQFECRLGNDRVDWSFCGQGISAGAIPPQLSGNFSIDEETNEGLTGRITGSSLTPQCSYSRYGETEIVGSCQGSGSSQSAPVYQSAYCQVEAGINTGYAWSEDVPTEFCGFDGDTQIGSVPCEAVYIGSLAHTCTGPIVEAMEVNIINGRYIQNGGRDWGPGSAGALVHNQLVTDVCTEAGAGCCESASRPGMETLNVVVYGPNSERQDYDEIPVQFGAYKYGHMPKWEPIQE